jgi:hypothetical protein
MRYIDRETERESEMELKKDGYKQSERKRENITTQA